MNDVYVNPRAPGSFGGVKALRRYARKSRNAVADYLARQDAYTLHKPTRIQFRVVERIRRVLPTYFKSIWWICRISRRESLAVQRPL